MGNLLKTPFSELVATVERLDHEGVTQEELKLIRSDDAVAASVKEVLARTLGETEVQQPILRLISDGHSLVIDATDGTALISEAKDVFTGWIDPNFVNWHVSEPSEPTPDTPVQVYELMRNATFEQMFSSICADWNQICLAQSQIIGFVEKYADWLHPNNLANFFPFKAIEDFFVADVHFDDRESLYASVHQFGYDYSWRAENRHRVVLPQL